MYLSVASKSFLRNNGNWDYRKADPRFPAQVSRFGYEVTAAVDQFLGNLGGVRFSVKYSLCGIKLNQFAALGMVPSIWNSVFGSVNIVQVPPAQLANPVLASVAGFTGCYVCLLYTSPSPRDQRGSRMPSSA